MHRVPLPVFEVKVRGELDLNRRQRGPIQRIAEIMRVDDLVKGSYLSKIGIFQLTSTIAQDYFRCAGFNRTSEMGGCLDSQP